MNTTLAAHPGESTLGFSDLSFEHQEIVRETLRSILESPHFRKSKRYPALLEFAVLHTLDGRSSSLKERIVGAEVFGRPADYDPSTDPVVRIAAGEVRRRLAQYFGEHPEAPVRIDLPVGGYTAEFHFRIQPADQATYPEPKPHAPTEAGSEDRIAGAAMDLPRWADPKLEIKPAMPFRWSRRLAFGIAAATLVLGIAGLGIWLNQQERSRHDFWWPVLHHREAAEIVVGRTLTATRSNLAMEDVFVTTQICTVFHKYGHDCDVSSAATATLENLRGKPVVSIGGFNNEWTTKLQASLPYQVRMGTSTGPVANGQRAIVQHGATADTTVATMGGDIPGGDYRDYAIIARFHTDLTGSMAAVIAGLGPEGTDGAGKFLFSPDNMNQLLAQAPKGWKGSDFEAVLEIDVVNGAPGPTKVVAAQFW